MFYSILGIRPGASEADIRAAYRRKALEVHPDKGGTAAAFARVQYAYQQALTRTPNGERRAAGMNVSKSRTSNPPPPWGCVRAPRTFPLSGGVSYVFETHPSVMGERLKAGDIVRTAAGIQGVVVGIASSGVVYFKVRGDSFASPIPASKCSAASQKYADVDILYRADAQQTTVAPTLPSTPRVFTPSSPCSATREGDGSTTPNTPKKGFRYTDVLERQRERTMTICTRKLFREEEERRALLNDVVDKAYANLRESKEAFLRALLSTVRPHSPRPALTPRKVTPTTRQWTPRVQRVPIFDTAAQ